LIFFLTDELSDGLRNDADDHALMLAAVHDCRVEIWHLGHINGTVTYPSVTTGSTQITSFDDAVVDVAFSPDSTAIAVASLDGYVRFFLVCENNLYLNKYLLNAAIFILGQY
jgi:WD40 repeat protein